MAAAIIGSFAGYAFAGYVQTYRAIYDPNTETTQFWMKGDLTVTGTINGSIMSTLSSPLNANGYAINNSSYMEVRAGVADPTERQSNIHGIGYVLKPPLGWVGSEYEAGYWIIGDSVTGGAGIIGWAIGHNANGDGTMNIYTGGERQAQIENSSGWQLYIGSRTPSTSNSFSGFILDDVNERDQRKILILNVRKQNGTVYADWRRQMRVYETLSSSNTKLSITMSVNQSVSSGGAFTAQFDKKTDGYDDIWNEYNTGTYTFIANRAGFYLNTVNIIGEPLASSYWQVDFVKNSQVVNSIDGTNRHASLTELIKMEAGDELIVVVSRGDTDIGDRQLIYYDEASHCSWNITRIP